MKKLYSIQPLWWTAKLDKFYTIYFVEGNGSEMTFVAGSTTFKLKNLKT